MNTLPLEKYWRSLGARFGEDRGIELPAFFSSPEAECLSVRGGAGLFDFSLRGKIEVTGSDRIALLHNILTNDIKSLAPGEGCRAMLLANTGKVLADMNVYIFKDSAVLDFEPGFETRFSALLDKYIITEDVQLASGPRDIAHLSIQGPQSEKILSKSLGEKIPALKKFQHVQLPFGASIIHVIKTAETGAEGFHLWIPAVRPESFAERILECGRPLGLLPAGFNAYEALRIEAGALRYGRDITEEVSLSETGLDDSTASETKGCYPGQEVVARTKTYKGLQRRACKILIYGGDIPHPGSKIFSNGKEIGWITSAAYSPGTGRTAGIGYLVKGCFEKPLKVSVMMPTGQVEAETQPLD